AVQLAQVTGVLHRRDAGDALEKLPGFLNALDADQFHGADDATDGRPGCAARRTGTLITAATQDQGVRPWHARSTRPPPGRSPAPVCCRSPRAFCPPWPSPARPSRRSKRPPAPAPPST